MEIGLVLGMCRIYFVVTVTMAKNLNLLKISRIPLCKTNTVDPCISKHLGSEKFAIARLFTNYQEIYVKHELFRNHKSSLMPSFLLSRSLLTPGSTIVPNIIQF